MFIDFDFDEIMIFEALQSVLAIASNLKGFTTRIYVGANYGRTQAGHKERRRLMIEVK